MVNTIGSRIKVSPQYWQWMTKRQPIIGDIHIADGVHYSVSDIIEDGARTIVLLSKRQINRKVRG